MTDKLNSSLDDILKTTRANTRRGRGNRRSGPGRRAAEAPVGGVVKTTKQTKPNKAAPAAPAGPSGGETKIMISNLPYDVEENQLKEYFATVVNVGKPRRILLQYGPNGKSLGSATVIFNKAEQAVKATNALQGVKIDNKPIRVEMLVSAASVAAQTPQTSFADRITQPKKADKPKPATATKAASAGGRERGRGRDRAAGRGRGRGGRERPKKKTQEELDAEMEDYFPAAEGGNDAMVTNGDAPQAAGGDTMEEDQML